MYSKLYGVIIFHILVIVSHDSDDTELVLSPKSCFPLFVNGLRHLAFRTKLNGIFLTPFEVASNKCNLVSIFRDLHICRLDF